MILLIDTDRMTVVLAEMIFVAMSATIEQPHFTELRTVLGFRNHHVTESNI